MQLSQKLWFFIFSRKASLSYILPTRFWPMYNISFPWQSYVFIQRIFFLVHLPPYKPPSCCLWREMQKSKSYWVIWGYLRPSFLFKAIDWLVNPDSPSVPITSIKLKKKTLFHKQDWGLLVEDSGSDPSDHSNYWLISKLHFISKIKWSQINCWKFWSIRFSDSNTSHRLPL